jgi:hypothetical protein
MSNELRRLVELKLPAVHIYSGFALFVGPARSGKTSFVQNANFKKMNGLFNPEADIVQLAIDTAEGDPSDNDIPMEQSELLLFCSTMLGLTNISNLKELHDHVINNDINIPSYVYTEMRQTSLPDNCIVARVSLGVKKPRFIVRRIIDGKVVKAYSSEHIPFLVLLLGMVGVCRVSSATPTYFKHPSLQDTTLKGGLSSGYIDSLAAYNADAFELNSSVVLEVRDDFDDDNNKLSASTALFLKLQNLSIIDDRLRENEDSGHTSGPDGTYDNHFIEPSKKFLAFFKKYIANKKNGISIDEDVDVEELRSGGLRNANLKMNR